jgi:PAS domain S-box-containing protein
MERADFEQWKAREVARLLALVEAERRYYQEMIAALPAALAVLASDQSVVYANRAFRQMCGLRVEELRRKTVDQILPAAGLAERIRQAHAEGRPPAPLEYTRQGRAWRLTIVPLRHWEEESEVETLLLVEDLSGASPLSRAGAEVPAILWQAAADTLAFQAVAGAVQDLSGRPAEYWINTPGYFEQRIHPEDRAAVMALYRRTVETGGQASAEYRALSAGGEIVWLRETIRVPAPAEEPRTITGVITDVARRRETERRTLAAGRRQALETLAARLAHDLNNPLAIASGYGEELLAALSETSPARSDAAELVAAVKRIAALASQLSEFGRAGGKPPEPLNLSAVLPAMKSDLEHSAAVTVEFPAGAQPLWASANREQLAEALLALASAARPGAAERTRLAISWALELPLECIGEAPPAPRARIALRDDGAGMDAATHARLFETVLVEKDPAGGALARAYALVREWGGDIGVAALSPRGTEFSVYLPAVAPPAAPGPAAAAVAEAPAPAPEPVRETILVVDDEAGIRGLMRKILRREHYQVLEAASAEDALAIAVSHAGPIHLLLTDVVLPRLSGPDLARRMYEASPSLKVLYISGYTDDESVRAGEFPPGARFLPKPFTLGALVASVRETLDA